MRPMQGGQVNEWECRTKRWIPGENPNGCKGVQCGAPIKLNLNDMENMVPPE